MIGCTKLLCGTATVAEAMRHGRDSAKLSPQMLQFSADNRPIVVWNMTNRCNLKCLHCYINAEDRAYRDELSTDEAKAFIDDICRMGCPVLLFSGGEPLLREDLFELGRYAAAGGIRPVISTNGTLITPQMAEKIKQAGFQYVGISIDGAEATHDHFRQHPGCFRAAIAGIKNCVAAGVKAGVRLTINIHNYKDLPAVLDIVEREGIPRFCMYHLVYAGRGRQMAKEDITPAESRHTMQLLIDRVLDWNQRGVKTEILTTDNHADGIFLWHYIRQHIPERAADVVQLLEMHGGCSAGGKMANVDPAGNVHPCQFWGHHTLGNIRELPFSRIWNNPDDPLLNKLHHMGEYLEGKCGRCKHQQLCGGCRIRAEAVHGNIWAEDPACYLTEEEIS
jgi:radical SAM protein with 4Fe4S-binding SPASM domain